MSNKFNSTQKSLLAVNALRVILELFTSTFMTSYILSLNPENVLGQGVFNIGIFYILRQKELNFPIPRWEDIKKE